MQEAAKSLPLPRLAGVVMNQAQKQFYILLAQKHRMTVIINSDVISNCDELPDDLFADGLRTKSFWKL